MTKQRAHLRKPVPRLSLRDRAVYRVLAHGRVWARARFDRQQFAFVITANQRVLTMDDIEAVALWDAPGARYADERERPQWFSVDHVYVEKAA